MPTDIRCPGCEKKLRIPDDAPKAVRCPKCKTVVRVREDPPPEAPAQITIRCKGCTKKLRLPENTSAKAVRCPHCQTVLSLKEALGTKNPATLGPAPHKASATLTPVPPPAPAPVPAPQQRQAPEPPPAPPRAEPEAPPPPPRQEIAPLPPPPAPEPPTEVWPGRSRDAVAALPPIPAPEPPAEFWPFPDEPEPPVVAPAPRKPGDDSDTPPERPGPMAAPMKQAGPRHGIATFGPGDDPGKELSKELGEGEWIIWLCRPATRKALTLSFAVLVGLSCLVAGVGLAFLVLSGKVDDLFGTGTNEGDRTMSYQIVLGLVAVGCTGVGLLATLPPMWKVLLRNARPLYALTDRRAIVRDDEGWQWSFTRGMLGDLSVAGRDVVFREHPSGTGALGFFDRDNAADLELLVREVLIDRMHNGAPLPDTAEEVAAGSIPLEELPAPWRDRVKHELKKGEQVLWFGRPTLIVEFTNGFGRSLAMLCAVGVLALAFVLAGRTVLKNFDPSAESLLLSGLIVGGAIAVLARPILGAWRASRSGYVLTNRRALVWQAEVLGGPDMTEYGPAHLALARRRKALFVRGAGDLVFREVEIPGSTGKGRLSRIPQTVYHGFLAIRDVRAVERLIREAVVDPHLERQVV